MTERWVRPPVVAREASPRWLGVWRFRLVGIVLAVLLAIGAWELYPSLSGQDPGIGTAPAPAPAVIRS